MKKTLLISALFLTLLAGCQSHIHSTTQSSLSSSTQDESNHFIYQCGTKNITVAYDKNRDVFILPIEGKMRTLLATISADGAKYSDGIYTFWGKGEEATIYKRDHVIYQNCLTHFAE